MQPEIDDLDKEGFSLTCDSFGQSCKSMPRCGTLISSSSTKLSLSRLAPTLYLSYVRMDPSRIWCEHDLA